MKSMITAAVVMASMCLGTSQVYAKQSAKTVFDGVYPGNSVSCFICHNGSPGVLTLYGASYTGNGGSKDGTAAAITAIETLDTDGDTMNNAIEIRNGTDPLSSTALGTAKVATSATNGDVLVNGTGVGTVTVTTVVLADYGLTLADGQGIIGDAQLQFSASAAPVTLTFAAAGAVGTVKVHQQTGTGTSSVIASTVSASGSVIFTPTTTLPSFYTVEYTPVVVADEGSNGGCMTSTLALPAGLMLLLLSLSFFIRRKDKL